MIILPCLAWIQAVIWFFVKAAILMAAARMLAPKPPGAKAASANEFNVPTAMEGRIIPILFGRRKMDAPNIIWYGKIRAEKIEEWTDKWFGKKMTTGHKYFMGMHAIISHCVDCISQVWFGEKVAWPIPLDPTQENTTGVTSIRIECQSLYGGDKREGGVYGDIAFQYGHADQTVDQYLLDALGPDQPAYRYQTGIIFKDFCIGNTPYPRPVSFMAHRTQILTDGTPQWYVAKADISGDMNPIHIIRECLTNTDWGMGESSGNLGTTFESCADQLFTEGFGLSLIWDASCSIQEFIGEVLAHIDGVLYLDYTTDKFEIKLLREVDPAGLTIYDEDEIMSFEYDTTTISEVVNKVVVQYTDLTNSQSPKTATAVDNSLVERQGGMEIEKVIEFPGIISDVIANKVAFRELRRYSAFLPPYTIKCTRALSDKLPGDIFKVSFAARGISELPVRVLTINLGTPDSNAVVIKAIKDVFANGVPVTYDNPPTEWVPPHSTPIDAPIQALQECPFYVVANTNPGYDTAINLPASAAKIMCLAARPIESTLGYEIWVLDMINLNYYEDGWGVWFPTATLTAALALNGASATIGLSNAIDLDLVPVNTLAQIGNEMVLVTAVNSSLNQVTISRGALDTVPVAHSPGERVWFWGRVWNVVTTQYATNDEVFTQYLTMASEGTLALGSATENSITLTEQRLIRPIPPGNFKINNVSFAPTFSGQPTLTWNHRTRETVNQIVAHDEAVNYGPESGATNILEIYKQDLVTLVRTVNPLPGTSFTYTEAMERADCGLGGGDPLNTQLRFKLWSTRGGLSSWKHYDHTSQRV